jgi:hypothetical protein
VVWLGISYMYPLVQTSTKRQKNKTEKNNKQQQQQKDNE